MKRALIFDFDGTIANSFELVMDIAYQLTDIEPRSPEEMERLRRLPLLKVIRELHVPMHKLPKLLMNGRQMMHERINEVEAFPHIPEALHALREMGYHMLVTSSNSEQNVREFLRTHGLESCFDGVYGGASVISKMGAIKQVLKRNKLSASECFYIGDEVRDVVAATKAGVEPIAVCWGYQAPEALAEYHPYALVREPKELITLLEKEKG